MTGNLLWIQFDYLGFHIGLSQGGTTTANWQYYCIVEETAGHNSVLINKHSTSQPQRLKSKINKRVKDAPKGGLRSPQ